MANPHAPLNCAHIDYECPHIELLVNTKLFFFLFFAEPISFEGTQQIQSVEDGSASFTLICKVTGNPRPKVTWNVRGTIVREDNDKYEVTSEGLVIKNITQSDKGAYKCKAIQLDEEITDFQDMIIQLRVQRKII